MDELGYRPNRAARALRSGRFRTIGVVMFTLASFGNMRTLEAISAAAAAADFTITLLPMASRTGEGVRSALSRLHEQAVDGVVIVIESHIIDTAEVALPDGVPLVVVDSTGTTDRPSIDIDQAEGARLATQHLLDLGHETVWHVAGPDGSYSADRRLAAWRDTLEHAGRAVPPVFTGGWASSDGYRAGQEIAARPEVTAVFAVNDQTALGVLRAAHEAGRSVPGSLSVVGFDDFPESESFWPPLTTVHQSFDEVGPPCRRHAPGADRGRAGRTVDRPRAGAPGGAREHGAARLTLPAPGRAPTTAEQTDGMTTFTSVTVLGAGVLGTQIALQTARHGVPVVVYDISDDAVAAGRERLAGIVEQYLGDVGEDARPDAEAAVARIDFATDLAQAVAAADLVIEAVPERLDLKRDVYARLAEVAPADTVFATNSSTLLPSAIADATGRPDRFLALHFANHVWRQNTAEVMGTEQTDPAVFERVATFAEEIGMVPIRLHKEQPGYVLNSLLVPLLDAAAGLVLRGVADPETVDTTWRIGTGPRWVRSRSTTSSASGRRTRSPARRRSRARRRGRSTCAPSTSTRAGTASSPARASTATADDGPAPGSRSRRDGREARGGAATRLPSVLGSPGGTRRTVSPVLPVLRPVPPRVGRRPPGRRRDP